MASEYYADGQLRKVAALMRGDPPPLWLLLAGPADGNEAQTARQVWPRVLMLGVEPNGWAVRFQHEHGWPSDAPLMLGALSDRVGECRVGGVSAEDRRHARLEEGGAATVPCWTLDTIGDTFGPFEQALLWLDVEGSEAAALRGAEGLLARGAVWWVTAETSTHLPEVAAEVGAILAGHGFAPAGVWSTSGGGTYKDTLWRLDDARRGAGTP